MIDFWKDLPASFFALAPMEDVTDTVFRELLLSVSDPGNLNILFSEFTSVDGLCHPKGRDAVAHRLRINAAEKQLLEHHHSKLVAQIWGSNPEKFYQASRYIAESFEFDGIDINLGCPVAKIVKQGACSALIGQYQLVNEIIQAVREGSCLPVSVKTRTGIKTHQTMAWMSHLLNSGVSAITLHARTQRMMSEKPAEWEQVKLAVDTRNQVNHYVKIIGNGDVESLLHGRELMEQTGADGVMVGRGVFGNPWFFAGEQTDRSVGEKLSLLEKHISNFAATWGNARNFSLLKRFFKIYINDFDGAALLRGHLMGSNNCVEALDAVARFRQSPLLH
ncbi:MAG: tRNA-dihydrouridine synthase [Lentimicrobium sp.]|nr:tRNA-dihydrouridine synthase [Lentimicrobium sp.]